MSLNDTIPCTFEGCTKTMYLKDGQYGQFYSHKEPDALKGYHTVNVDKLDQAGSQPSHTVTRTTNPRSEAGVEYNRVDREEVARGKTRCAVFCAVVGKDGLEVALGSQNKIELATSYIMNGLGTEEPEF